MNQPKTTPRPADRPTSPRAALRSARGVGRTLFPTLAALLLGAAAAAQTQRSVPRPQEFVTTQEDSLFSLMRSQEDVHQWEQALADRDAGDYASAAERLQKLLQNEVGGTAAIGPNRFVGLRHAVVLTLANLPAAGIAAYEELVRREAGSLFDADPTTLRREQLDMLAQRFPTSRIGRAARLRLGDLALEAGDGAVAICHFDAAFAAAPIGSDQERQALERRACADALVRSATLRNQPGLPAAVRDVLDVLPPAQDRQDWPAFGGGNDGARPMTDPIGRPRPHWSDAIVAPGFDDEGRGSGSFAMQVTGGLDALYVNTGLELQAIDPLRGEQLWSSVSPLREQVEQRRLSEYLQSINQDMILSTALAGDIVVAALQVPDDQSAVRYQNAFTIVHRIPERRLFAFQRSTGNLLWSHFDRLDGPVTQRFRGHASCGPPLIVGDTVYAPMHDRAGAIAFYVAAYDLRTGEPRWRRLICSSQQEVNMFGNARMEFAASPLCATNGLLLGCSNLGVCYAVEIATGHCRWITSYDVIKMPAAQLQGQESRPVRFQNSAPVVAADVLCCTPLDSDFVLGLDAVTGEPLWRVPFEAKAQGNNDVRWLCGALGDEFVLAGRGVVAVAARAQPQRSGVPPLRRIRAPEALRSEDRDPPRPALTDRWIYYPTDSGISVFDANGQMAPGSADLRLQSPGNLLLVDGIVVSTANNSFELLLDAAALRTRAEERLQKGADDPAAIMRLCTLRAALDPEGTDRAALEALYRRGLAACEHQGLPADNPLHAAFLRRLFDIALARGERTSGDAGLALLTAARDLAPDTAAFLRVQSRVLERCRDNRARLLLELDQLLARAPDASFALPEAGGTVEVAAYVAWRKALLCDDPRQRVVAFQELLLRHGDATIRQQSVATLAQQTISHLIAEHGRAVYADVEARAAAMLADSGTSTESLLAVGRAYPHSEAAVQARARLLDAAVAQGDLGTAIDMFAVAARDDGDGPSLLRRVLEAAHVRGNLDLARAIAERLLTVEAASDWAADRGASYAAAARTLLAELPAPRLPTAASVPAELVAQVPSPSPPFGFRLVPTRVEAGFPGDIEPLLYVGFDDQLRAIDLRDPARPTVFTHKSGHVDRVWVCGRTLVIPTIDRITALDARTGAPQWQFTANGKILICHGMVRGVLQVTQRNGSEDVSLLGFEPLTGHQVFARPMPAATQAPQPKPTATQVLVLHTPDNGDAVVQRLDPLTGRVLAGVPLTEELRAAAHAPAEVLQSGLLLQRFAADDALLFVPIDSSLSQGPPRVFAVAKDGSVAWTWEGTRGCHLYMTALRSSADGGRLCAVESSTPGGGRAVVLRAATGEVVREVPIGGDVQVLNWQLQREAAPAPMALLLSDFDAQRGDRRLVCVPIDDGLPSFAQSLGGNGEEIVRTPWITRDLLVFGVHSPRTQGPVRLFALHPQDRSTALPDGQSSLMLPVPPRSPHEMGSAGPYTVLVTDARLFVLGDGKEIR